MANKFEILTPHTSMKMTHLSGVRKENVKGKLKEKKSIAAQDEAQAVP
jgi:hypothetical protein